MTLDRRRRLAVELGRDPGLLLLQRRHPAMRRIEIVAGRIELSLGAHAAPGEIGLPIMLLLEVGDVALGLLDVRGTLGIARPQRLELGRSHPHLGLGRGERAAVGLVVEREQHLARG